MDMLSHRLMLHYLANLGEASGDFGTSLHSEHASGNVERLLLTRNDWMPNNNSHPVRLYRQALKDKGLPDPAGTQQLFKAHGWPAQWVDGIYDYHHYHSNAHEVLGVIQGHARIMVGGPGGQELSVQAGDVLVLPAGTGHCNLGSSEDFLVVGGYPYSQEPDLCRAAPTAEQQRAIEQTPYPSSDPVLG
ncbi:cupin domain-containing protein [Pseudomonas sp. CrR14]|nr:cupin domain-containing protein [Pseudomonas sp. CrR14]